MTAIHYPLYRQQISGRIKSLELAMVAAVQWQWLARVLNFGNNVVGCLFIQHWFKTAGTTCRKMFNLRHVKAVFIKGLLLKRLYSEGKSQ